MRGGGLVCWKKEEEELRSSAETKRDNASTNTTNIDRNK